MYYNINNEGYALAYSQVSNGNVERRNTPMVFEKVQKLLAEQLNIDDANSITMESNVIADLHADSLDVVEMLMSLEDEFGISVPDEIANELVTVKAIVEFIESQK